MTKLTLELCQILELLTRDKLEIILTLEMCPL